MEATHLPVATGADVRPTSHIHYNGLEKRDHLLKARAHVRTTGAAACIAIGTSEEGAGSIRGLKRGKAGQTCRSIIIGDKPGTSGKQEQITNKFATDKCLLFP